MASHFVVAILSIRPVDHTPLARAGTAEDIVGPAIFLASDLSAFVTGSIVTVDGGYQSRRISDGTLCQISGPAASAIGSTVQGLLGPQGGCITPWATALLAEGDAANWLNRLSGTGLGYNDPTVAPRFSWITEIDPLDPLSIPTKRTALGRFARSAVAAML